MKTEEGKVKDGVKAYLAKRGAYVFMPVQTGYGKRTLDILFCLQGRFGTIETKAPGKEPDGFQQTIMAEVKAAGGWVCWGDNALQITGFIQQAFPEAPPRRPVAWRVKDFADGWIIFQDEALAHREAEATGAIMQGLYARDGT